MIDEAFLKFLQVSRANVSGDTQRYLRSLKEKIDYFIVVPRKVNQVCIKEIMMVSKSKIWHLSYDKLMSLKYSEVYVVINLIEKTNNNNKSLYDDLRNDQPYRMPEVCTNPRTILYQFGTRPEDIDQLVIPKHLTHKNNS